MESRARLSVHRSESKVHAMLSPAAGFIMR